MFLINSVFNVQSQYIIHNELLKYFLLFYSYRSPFPNDKYLPKKVTQNDNKFFSGANSITKTDIGSFSSFSVGLISNGVISIASPL